MRDQRGFVGIEMLESRRLLSGNVVVTNFDAGGGVYFLNIVGDSKSNAFELRITGNFHFTGLNGTTINGRPNLTVDPVLNGGIKIDMGNGDDVVTLPQSIFNFSVPVSIATGNGNDTVSMSNWQMSGGLNLDTGAGNDTVLLQDCAINGSRAVIDTGNGDDHISFAGSISGDGDITVNGGRGRDSVSGVASLLVTGTESLFDVETIA